MERPSFINDEIYNRGVEKRNVFLDNRDYFRFIRGLFEFNDILPSLNLYRRFQPTTAVGSPTSNKDNLVDILCFCLMPNHYHLLLRQKVDSGITEFMRKIGTGYTNYFNLRYQRVGSLFQGKFKAIHISKESHLLYLPHYIHFNPLDLTLPEWRKKRLYNINIALEFLKSYRWSSYLDYIGKRNFPMITNRQFILQLYSPKGVGSPTSNIFYRKDAAEWLKELSFEFIKDIVLEEI